MLADLLSHQNISSLFKAWEQNISAKDNQSGSSKESYCLAATLCPGIITNFSPIFEIPCEKPLRIGTREE